jgi:hypothetical protein
VPRLAVRTDLPVRTADRLFCLPHLFPLPLLPQIEVALEQQPQQLTAPGTDKVFEFVMGQRGRLRAGQRTFQAVEGPCRGSERIDGIEGVVGFHRLFFLRLRFGWHLRS